MSATHTAIVTCGRYRSEIAAKKAKLATMEDLKKEIAQMEKEFAAFKTAAGVTDADLNPQAAEASAATSSPLAAASPAATSTTTSGPGSGGAGS